MGRIKGTLVKRATKDLMKEDSTKFSADFEKNKKVVSEAIPGMNKKIRNSIAGYIARLQTKNKKKK